MSKKYYFDTCIWRDHYEARSSLIGRPLGEYASKLFAKLIKKKEIILYYELIISELKKDFNNEDINNMFNILFITGILKKVEVNKEDYLFAKELSNKRKLPVYDVLHAIISSRNKAILVTQDKHMQKLKDIVVVKKPEELI
jgi:predicted nucleic acid-binding protein